MRFIIDRIMNLSRLGIAMSLGVLVILGLVAFVLVARVVNTTPSQCASCHPEIAALWEKSRVHTPVNATCYQCHAAHAELPLSYNLPGYVRDLLIPEKYMAGAERIDGRCLTCHTGIPAADKEKGKLIKVNHKVHLEKPLDKGGMKVKLTCVSCHESIAHDLKANPTNRPTMQGCFAGGCHVNDRKAENCTRCHYQSLLDKVTAMAEGEKAAK